MAETVLQSNGTVSITSRSGLKSALASPWWLTAPAIVYIALVFALPLVSLVAMSFINDGRLSLANYSEFLSDAHYRQSIWNTLRFALFSSVGCVVVGFPYGLLMTRLGGRWQAILLLLMLIPMASSIVVRTFGWTILLRRDGLINKVLMGLGIVDEPIRLIFTEFGLVMGAISLMLPLVILPVYSVVRLIPKDLVPSALCLGATPVQSFLRITLPLAIPGALLGFAFVFTQAAAAYVLPSLLAGFSYKTMSMTIVEAYLSLQNPAVGSTVSVLLIATVLLVIVAAGKLARRLGAKS